MADDPVDLIIRALAELDRRRDSASIAAALQLSLALHFLGAKDPGLPADRDQIDPWQVAA